MRRVLLTQHEEIVKFFDGNYTTRIGYGLHYGWAIEGAVGTNIKIDCSYLSPNVNLAARLEGSCEPGKILVSHPTWLLVRDEIPCEPKGEIRVKNVRDPVRVYEVDPLG